MKAGQNTIVRWVAKLVHKQPRRVVSKTTTRIREIDPGQLRQIGGGLTDADTPYKGW
jgi:hypothetical protein